MNIPDSESRRFSFLLLLGGVCIGIVLTLFVISTSRAIVTPPVSVPTVSSASFAITPSATTSPTAVRSPLPTFVPSYTSSPTVRLPTPTLHPPTVVAMVLTATPQATTAETTARLPTMTPIVIVVTATPQPRNQALVPGPSLLYRVSQISCASNPATWHHGPFTIEGTVYVPTAKTGSVGKIWANHALVAGSKALGGPVQVSNETEQWIPRLFVLPLYENGGPGIWYVWVAENNQRASEIAQITVDPLCPHGVVDFSWVGAH